MKRLVSLLALTMAVTTAPLFAQVQNHGPVTKSFASDLQTIPVVGNVPGVGGANFQTYVALLNPTSSAFTITATLYDVNGNKRIAQIALAAGELKTYSNFLDGVFGGFTGGGALTLQSSDTAGGTRNNRFIVSAEVKTAGTRYGTTVPALEFPGTSSRAFSPGVTVDTSARTNIGCFNQSDAANIIKATVLDSTGKLSLGTINLNLPPHAWAQTSVNVIVLGGTIQFDPSDSAVCYAVVVDNSTNDGRFVPAAEYQP